MRRLVVLLVLLGCRDDKWAYDNAIVPCHVKVVAVRERPYGRGWVAKIEFVGGQQRDHFPVEWEPKVGDTFTLPLWRHLTYGPEPSEPR